MRSVLAYTAARFLLFGVAYGVLYLLGARGWLALILAALVSGLVSYILLSRQRDAVSERITARTDRMSRRLVDGAAHEDVPDVPSEPKSAGSGRADGGTGGTEPAEGAETAADDAAEDAGNAGDAEGSGKEEKEEAKGQAAGTA
ncbi:DUF4229 domain-containing protein [Nocardiopsis sp. RSe5-2]|uniref:DUF4229 domain-containing protein n=1 Tax=Nocardiopsis endophytica TaxID=3018445 RepID=A0ABT4UC59_9ACTN|nr:DUF4229 domain-containing protein [Nocardiopsis endophytica]MDA2814543.1 DUF4229 domain-containing protein [Nocardiopsis endophytica]